MLHNTADRSVDHIARGFIFVLVLMEMPQDLVAAAVPQLKTAKRGCHKQDRTDPRFDRTYHAVISLKPPTPIHTIQDRVHES